MYKIDTEPIDRGSSNAKHLLDTMLDVMDNIQQVDDTPYSLKMKILNNIEFLVDQLMEEYEQKR